MELIRFDKNVHLYTPQPITIAYRDAQGKTRRYTPDGFIQYRRDIMPAIQMPHTLCEIKYRTDLGTKWQELLPKWRAARRHCAQNGWKFMVITEREIRTPYLENVRFLWPYRSGDNANAVLADEMLHHISEMRETDPEALLCTMFRDRWNRATALPTLWYLISNFQIGCDLMRPLGMKSTIWKLED